MQIINGKKYNDFKIGGFILLVPVYGKEGEQFVLGEIKDVALRLKAISENAREENKKQYQEARRNFIRIQNRLNEIDGQFRILPQSGTIEDLEARKVLSEEKRKLQGDLYHQSKRIDQLFDKDFIPHKNAYTEPVQKMPVGEELPQKTYPQTDGYKVRQLRKSLGESQAQFAKHFNVSAGLVSQWEKNMVKARKEVLEYNALPKKSQTVPLME